MSRVLFITSKPCHPWDGGGWRTRRILEALVALGYAVDLVTVPSDTPCRVKGVNVHPVPRLPFCARLPEGVSLRRGILDMLMLCKAVFLAGRFRHDIIHGVDDCGVVAWMAAALTRKPYLDDVRDGVVGGPVAWRRRWLRIIAGGLRRRALRRADVVIGENPGAVAALAQWGRQARACVIPDIPALTAPVPVPMLNLARARFRGGGENKVVTCVGGHNHFKGMNAFFNAVPNVLREAPNVRFAVAGGTAAQIGYVREALGQAGVGGGAVTFAGGMPPEELAALLAVSDILVAPCHEGGGVQMRVLDYLHASKPIVVMEGGFSKVIFSGHNALVVGGGHEALAQGVLHLLRHPQIADEIARRGPETLLVQHRTPEAFRDALRQGYEYGMGH